MTSWLSVILKYILRQVDYQIYENIYYDKLILPQILSESAIYSPSTETKRFLQQVDLSLDLNRGRCMSDQFIHLACKNLTLTRFQQTHSPIKKKKFDLANSNVNPFLVILYSKIVMFIISSWIIYFFLQYSTAGRSMSICILFDLKIEDWSFARFFCKMK